MNAWTAASHWFVVWKTHVKNGLSTPREQMLAAEAQASFVMFLALEITDFK